MFVLLHAATPNVSATHTVARMVRVDILLGIALLAETDVWIHGPTCSKPRRLRVPYGLNVERRRIRGRSY
jgi:hypothetical protein